MVKSKAKRKELAQLGRIKHVHSTGSARNGDLTNSIAPIGRSKKRRRREKKLAKRTQLDDEDGDEPPQLVPIAQAVDETAVTTSTHQTIKNKTEKKTVVRAFELSSQVISVHQLTRGLITTDSEEQDHQQDHEVYEASKEVESDDQECEDERPEEYLLLYQPVESSIAGTSNVVRHMQGYQPMPSKANKRSASEANLLDSGDVATDEQVHFEDEDANTPSDHSQDKQDHDQTEQGDAKDGGEETKEVGHVVKRIRTEESLSASDVYKVQQSIDSTLERRVRYTKASQLPLDMAKYWHQRYRYFSLYDEGIHMDKEGWYSVTPEKIAGHIAERCACDVIIDAFCGVGGNAIQFALTCHRVIAIDIDPVRLECAKHNARIYGVEDRIEFILGDYMTLIPRLKADVVFLSPPWGGPSYSEREFDLQKDIPMDGEHLFRETQKITPHIAYYLPRNSNAEQIGRLAGEGQTCEINKNVLNGACKAWTAYFGELQLPQGEDGDWTDGAPGAQGDWTDGGSGQNEDGSAEDGGWGMSTTALSTNGQSGSKKKKKKNKKKSKQEVQESE